MGFRASVLGFREIGLQVTFPFSHNRCMFEGLAIEDPCCFSSYSRRLRSVSFDAYPDPLKDPKNGTPPT